MTSRGDDFKYPRAFLDPTDAFNARALENHLRQLAWDVVETSLRSENWDGGTDLSGGKDGTATQGFFLDVESGSIQAMNLFAEGGELGDLDVTGSLVLDGGTFSSAASGNRVEIDSTNINYVNFYTGHVNEGDSASISVNTTEPFAMFIASPMPVAVGQSNSAISLQSDSNNGLVARSITISTDTTVISANGSITVPSLQISSASKHGFFRYDASNLGVVANNGLAMAISQGGVTIMGDYLYFNGTSGHEYIQFNDASNWARFVLDNAEHFRVNTSGIQLPNNKAIDFAAHSSTYIRESYGIELHGDPTHPVQILAPTLLGIDATGGTFTNGYVYHAPPTTGVAANACWILASGSIYYMMRSTSARKYKDQIDYGFPLADYELRPNKHWRLDDEKYFVGFIADDLAEQNPIFATYDEDGEVENYEDRAVLAVLAAKVNRLEELVLQGRE